MIALLAASLLWAFSFGLVKRHLAGIDPAFVAHARLLLALLLFLPLLRPRRVPHDLVLPLLGVGAVQFGLMYVFYQASFAHLASHEVALFTVLTPLHVVLVEMALTRRWRASPLLAAGLAVVGAGVIVWGGLDSSRPWHGFLLVQAANACFAVGQVAYRRLLAGRDACQPSLFAFLYLGGSGVAAIAASFGPGADLAALTGPQIATLLYLGLLASGLGFFLWNFGATRVELGTLAVWNDAKVPAAVLVSLLVFGESARWTHLLVGSALLALALWYTARPWVASR